MKNRIDAKFDELQKAHKKALITYITCGDPSLTITKELVLSFDKAGVDIIELGVPFSDPLADGTTIQEASARALAKGVTLAKIFDLVRSIRQVSNIPIALMTYYNPVFAFGEEHFIQLAKKTGVDGVIIPDLPPEEATTLRHLAKRENIATIFFISPTTTDERIKHNAQASSGFIYYVALAGVTGSKQADAQDVVKLIKHAKKFTSKPICAGFGISTPAQAKAINQYADGVIIGSAIIKSIQQYAGKKDLVKRVTDFVTQLRQAC